MKTMSERRFEAATWGVLFIWLGVTMMVRERAGLTGVVAGGILLASALIQKVVGWEAGAVLWVAGLALLFSGLNELLGQRNVPVASVLLILFGAFILFRAAGGRTRARHRIHRSPRPDGGDFIDL